MIKSRVSLAIALSTTILGGVLLSSASANACYHNKIDAAGVGSERSPNSPAGEALNPRRSTPSNSSRDIPRSSFGPSDSTTDLKIAGAGLMAIGGFLMFGLLQKIRGSGNSDSAIGEILAKHPEVEHPELMLTGFPKEACCCEKLEEVTSVR
jgi:hypothetical protein